MGAFLMMYSLTEDIKRELKSINDIVKSDKTRSPIYKQLREFIEFHSSVKQLSKCY